MGKIDRLPKTWTRIVIHDPGCPGRWPAMERIFQFYAGQPHSIPRPGKLGKATSEKNIVETINFCLRNGGSYVVE